ncbi:helix-turn-helix transcriptional regulator [Pseudoalteromonas sp. PAB 2.2]|uniref:helix-turn-helix transcriptional regulator n=1 Tax=Pseudoalteromonas sp. PAB 2.2 TaxID=1841508 RepID=UPI00094F8DA3|nr:helix-turn-helix transcriptional regulator [Pseudoalteromonas sp. PAB 2.2]
MKPTIWINLGIITIYGTSLDAAPHSHNSIQIIWGKGPNCKLNGINTTGATIIDSKFEHQLEMLEGWVLLIEPKSKLGIELSAKLAGESFKSFKLPNYTANEAPNLTESPIPYLAPLFDNLHLSKHFLLANESSVEDKRVQKLLTELNHCLHGVCIKPTSWKASEVASKLALSESRFLHLFSEEMGIAWRPYLLWRRMMCAIQALANNRSATDAAHLAGFSDSAHLSRTFKSNFGMSIRQALKIFGK